MISVQNCCTVRFCELGRSDIWINYDEVPVKIDRKCSITSGATYSKNSFSHVKYKRREKKSKDAAHISAAGGIYQSASSPIAQAQKRGADGRSQEDCYLVTGCENRHSCTPTSWLDRTTATTSHDQRSFFSDCVNKHRSYDVVDHVTQQTTFTDFHSR